MTENPFASPQTDTASAQPKSPAKHYFYRPMGRLTLATAIATGVSIVSMLAVSVMEIIGEVIWPGFNDPNAWLLSESAELFFNSVLMVSMLVLPFYLATVVLWPMVTYRSNANLRALGVTTLTHSPGWSAGYWFVPVVNLFRPYQVVKELLFYATEDIAPAGAKPVMPWLPLWWGLYVPGSLIANVEARLFQSDYYIRDVYLGMSMASSLLLLGAGILFIRVIRQIGKRQDEANKATGPEVQSSARNIFSE